MYWKVLKGTELFDKLDHIRMGVIAAQNCAWDLAKKQGAESVRGDMFILAGGISGMHFPNGKPSGYKKVYSSHFTDCYMPSDIKKNDKLLAEIKALPRIEYTALNDVLKYKKSDVIFSDNRMVFYPRTMFQKKEMLISLPDYVTGYKPVKDMIEITVSEYNKLNKVKSKDEA